MFGSGPTQIAEIAKSQKIPIRFLEQILLLLKRSGIVVSFRGKEGGYALKKHPSDISLLAVVEILDGDLELTNKRLKTIPVLFDVFSTLQKNLKSGLAGITIEDLTFKKRQMERAYTYNI